ncbi:MAG TPA: cytochrome c oxidase assembly factor Coa1 family protein [Holophagaceae bacterium]|nr:cytochrome c oxidase assembly factor Coa1 family protein [Holophagaceae bacterium]
MTSLRSFAGLRPAGWICLIAWGLGASPTPAQTAPPRTSALRRWWNGLARGFSEVTITGNTTTVVESGGGGPERVYQTWKDATGSPQERYWVDGVARPVEPAVHQWATAKIQESQGAPPDPPAPPQPPVPPPPHAFVPGEAGRAAFQQVQHDARLLRMLGSPIALAPTAKGSLHTWGAGEPQGWKHFTLQEGAAADLTVELSGPRGTARLHAKGQRRGSTWTFSTLDLTQAESGPALDLLKP